MAGTISIEKLRELLEPFALQNSTGLGGGTTIIDQYRNANRMQNALDDFVADGTIERDSDIYNNFASQYKGAKLNAIGNGIVTGLTGITGIASNAVRSSQINDTTQQRDAIADRNEFGTYGYGTYTQLANDAASQNLLKPVSYQSIRGMTNAQKAGSLLSSAATGFASGSQIGGLWGGVAGAAVGLIGAGAGIIKGNNDARLEQQSLENQAVLANNAADINLQAGHNRLGYNNKVRSAVNVAASGGFVRKRESAKSFAERRMRIPRQLSQTADIVRTYEDGGVRIKIRVK